MKRPLLPVPACIPHQLQAPLVIADRMSLNVRTDRGPRGTTEFKREEHSCPSSQLSTEGRQDENPQSPRPGSVSCSAPHRRAPEENSGSIPSLLGHPPRGQEGTSSNWDTHPSAHNSRSLTPARLLRQRAISHRDLGNAGEEGCGLGFQE